MCEINRDAALSTACLRAPLDLAKREGDIPKTPQYRSKFMRDRDRIMYSKSFRRLAGKTQVYLSGLDDHQRTRMTHTLEVSQIARTISTALGLDTDLTEAIALGHDLGHTPFGHVGERTLHEIMTGACGEKNPIGAENPFINMNEKQSAYLHNSYGFKHNLQGLKCTMKFEKNYGKFGLNLTNFTLFGIQAHSSAVYKRNKAEFGDKLNHYDTFLDAGCKLENRNDAWSFEALVVAEADEIAQIHHDLEDAIRGNLLSIDEVKSLIKENFGTYLLNNGAPQNHEKSYQEQIPDNAIFGEISSDEETFITKMSQVIINLLVTRLIEYSRDAMRNFIRNQFQCSQEEYHNEFKKFLQETSYKEIVDLEIITYDNSEGMGFKENLKKFQKYTSQVILSSHDIQKSDSKGKYVIRKLFQAYYTSPQQLPDHCFDEYFKSLNMEIEDKKLRIEFSKIKSSTQTHQEKIALMRVVCDYIAGMTDHYALNRHRELYT